MVERTITASFWSVGSRITNDLSIFISLAGTIRRCGEGGIPGSEIVNRYAHAHLREVVEDRLRAAWVAHHPALSDLKHQCVRRDILLRQQLRNLAPIQVLIISIVPSLPDGLLATAHLSSYAFLGYFIWHNRSMTGLWLIALGWALNTAVIAANGGVMPTGRAVAEAAPRGVPASDFVNSLVLDEPKLEFLGDIFALPHGWPLQNVFSIGNVLLGIGVVVVLHAACGTWPAKVVAVRRR